MIVIKSTGQDYDFGYTIENLTDTKINFYLNGLDDYLEIKGNNGDYSWNYIY